MRISDWSSDVCSSDLVLCDGCNGERFNRDTLNVTWRGKSAGEVLKMEVDEAVEFFAAHSKISRILQLMQDVGLGYLTLGQPSPTLSGGEAQRKIGRAHVLTPVPNAHLVCRLLLEKKNKQKQQK